VNFAHLQVSGGSDTATNSQDGDGINCPADGGAATRSVDLDDMALVSNSGNGLQARSCPVTARRSVFRSNVAEGLFVVDNDVTVDRCELSNNGQNGLNSDGGALHASNVLAVRNMRNGIEYYSANLAGTIEFSTVVDNAGYGIRLQQAPNTGFVNVTNDLIARNGMGTTQCFTLNCLYTGTIGIQGTDLSVLHFASPDSQPYDYHLSAGSIAIDAAVNATLDHDFDGDARPKGQGRDVGADEAQ
jgi:hypothetical protein